ncbi:hypothetical protein B0H11DRAFT_1929456 [Mycena galericulata]|nr:hypothetical protein B0H11DRAFT_1929456 [Mycena galericulata]
MFLEAISEDCSGCLPPSPPVKKFNLIESGLSPNHQERESGPILPVYFRVTQTRKLCDALVYLVFSSIILSKSSFHTHEQVQRFSVILYSRPKNVVIVQDTDGEDEAGASEDLEPRRKKRCSEAESLIAANADSSKSASTPASKTVPAASKAPATSSASSAGQPRPKAKPVPRQNKQASPPAPEAPVPPPPRSPTPPPSKISQHELVFHMPDPRTLPPNQRFLGRALPDVVSSGSLFIEYANDAVFNFHVDVRESHNPVPAASARRLSVLSEFFHELFRRRPELLYGNGQLYRSKAFWKKPQGYHWVRGMMDYLDTFRELYPTLADYPLSDPAAEDPFFLDPNDPRPELVQTELPPVQPISLEGLSPADLPSIRKRMADVTALRQAQSVELTTKVFNKWADETFEWQARVATRRADFVKQEQDRADRIYRYNVTCKGIQKTVLSNISFMGEFAVFLEDSATQGFPPLVRPSLSNASTPEREFPPSRRQPLDVFQPSSSSAARLQSPAVTIASSHRKPSPPLPVAGPSSSRAELPNAASRSVVEEPVASEDPADLFTEASAGDDLYSLDEDPVDATPPPPDRKGKGKAKTKSPVPPSVPPIPPSSSVVHPGLEMGPKPPCFAFSRLEEFPTGFYSEYHHHEPMADLKPTRKPPKGGRNHKKDDVIRMITHGWPWSNRADSVAITEGFEEIRMPLQDMPALVYFTRGPGCTRCISLSLICAWNRQGPDMVHNCLSCRDVGVACKLGEEFDFAETDVAVRAANEKLFEMTIRHFTRLYSEVLGENMAVRLLGLSIFLSKGSQNTENSASSSSQRPDPLALVKEDHPLLRAARNELLKNSIAAVTRDSTVAKPFSEFTIPLARHLRESARSTLESADALLGNMMISARGINESWSDRFVGDSRGAPNDDAIEADGSGPCNLAFRLDKAAEGDVSMEGATGDGKGWSPASNEGTGVLGGEEGELVAKGAPATEEEGSHAMTVDAPVPPAPHFEGVVPGAGAIQMPPSFFFPPSSSSSLRNALGPFGYVPPPPPRPPLWSDLGPRAPLFDLRLIKKPAGVPDDSDVPPIATLGEVSLKESGEGTASF